MKLCEKLVSLRKVNNMTQEQIADKIGVTRSAYAYYENGKTMPKLSTLQRLTEIYNIGMDDLLDEDYVVAQTAVNYNNRRSLEMFNELTDYEQNLVLKTRMLSKDKKIELMKIVDEL